MVTVLEIAAAVVRIVHGFVRARVWLPAYSADAAGAGPTRPTHGCLVTREGSR